LLVNGWMIGRLPDAWAAAVGVVDEAHDDPDRAPSGGPTMNPPGWHVTVLPERVALHALAHGSAFRG
jgi:3-deoxy-D-manno-octulosonic acid (KDO) 8-phosphate synthase